MTSSSATAPASLGAPSTRNWRDWVGLIARLVPGAVFVYAGVVKVINIPYFIENIEAYQIGFLTSPWSDVLGHVLPVIEIVAGLLMILGLLTRWSSAAVMAMLIAFIGGIVWVWSQGINIDCGCFGDGGLVDPGETKYPRKLLENLGMAILCGWLVLRPRSLFSLDHLLFGSPTGPIAADDLPTDPDQESND